ncbi:MAG TPA: hypothetical protein VGY58_05725, partial [Gemmataceae bacterium]|nr:hypothetical protein [Gemmataceae bacterium]
MALHPSFVGNEKLRTLQPLRETTEDNGEGFVAGQVLGRLLRRVTDWYETSPTETWDTNTGLSTPAITI